MSAMSPDIPLDLTCCRWCGHERQYHARPRRSHHECAVCLCPGYRRTWPWTKTLPITFLPQPVVPYRAWLERHPEPDPDPADDRIRA